MPSLGFALLRISHVMARAAVALQGLGPVASLAVPGIHPAEFHILRPRAAQRGPQEVTAQQCPWEEVVMLHHAPNLYDP